MCATTLPRPPSFLGLSAPLGRGRAEAEPLLVSAAGQTAAWEIFTDTEHCFLTGNYFGKLYADAYGIYFVLFFFFFLFNIGICWYGCAVCERRHCWKNFGAITGKQNISAMFMNCVQMGHCILFYYYFFWFAYKLL